jgi:hypothetical protein
MGGQDPQTPYTQLFLNERALPLLISAFGGRLDGRGLELKA